MDHCEPRDHLLATLSRPPNGPEPYCGNPPCGFTVAVAVAVAVASPPACPSSLSRPSDAVCPSWTLSVAMTVVPSIPPLVDMREESGEGVYADIGRLEEGESGSG